MIRLDDLGLFARTAALGSFSSAAREAGLLPGQVSAAIKRLERELDVRLFARSTRSLRLTAEGEQYLPYAAEVLAALREGGERLRGENSGLQGVLQVAAPSDLGRNVLLPWLSEFRAAHPGLTLRLFLSDQVTDVFRDPVDAAIRMGRFDDASYVALPLAPDNRRVLVAAPAYLRRRGRPRMLEELAAHDCLLYMLGGRAYDRWRFVEDGRERVVPVRGCLLCDDADVVRRLAVDGEGIAYKSWLDVCADVRAGRLEVLLDGAGQPAPLHLVCPHRRQFSPAIRQLHALLESRCGALVAELRTRAVAHAETAPA
ncbi:LysR family transcriptional regulator [Coralloluteibacterium stylophorae]|uniref:LysR family transcriptional regulator n=1 Tax=Coralloluteibacterium stylophorae TaxID=1776034 RepID=A0A8J8AYN9_9GAMM|nr:LysR family transcriptional regulator [Coralloluteibacterium stylophorae]MBS7456957.1 LysR family transcriptional regulator [Coralloluteibacterium stylophorae]